MPGPSRTSPAGTASTSLRTTWDRCAREDAMHFIATRQAPWDETAFFESGAETIRAAVAWLGADHARRRALDIGCGIGRLSVHLTACFDQVDAIDISPEMIKQARERHHSNDHLSFHVGTGTDLTPLPSGAFDLVFSCLVFQHIASDDILASYFSEVARVLHPEGCAILQFDSRPHALARRIYHALPEWLLPREHRVNVRRYPRRPEALEQAFERAGLIPVDQRDRGGPAHFVKLALP